MSLALDLGFVGSLGLISLGLGTGLLRLLGAMPDDPSDARALALPLGLGTIGLALLGLGEVGWLGPPGVWAILGLSGLVGVFVRPSLGRSDRSAPIGRVDRAWDVAMALGLVGTLLTALAPATDGDALCYHLQVPKVFLASGSVGFDPDLHETVYPLLTEMLYASALAVRGPVACRLVQWLLGVSFAMSVAAMARPVLGDRARWAATVALLVPAVSNGMGAPLNDVALAAFGNAAIVAGLRWLDRPRRGDAALAGLLAGMAIGVKYPALVLVGLIGLGMVARASGARRADWFGQAVGFGLIAVVVGGPWYLRAFLYTGNPVYPFFRGVFGGSGLDEVLDPIKRPMATTPWNLLTAIVPMTLRPARFDSVSHQLGPLFLIGLPALALERAPRKVWGIVAIGYVFLTLCLTQRQSTRFILTAVGPMAVGVAWLGSRWASRPGLPSRALTALLVLVLAGESVIAVGRARHGLPVVLGRESAEAYLTRREPTYRVGRWIDRSLPASARIVGQDHRGFYIPRPYAMELAHRRRTGLGNKGESAEEVVLALRRDGFTHLLLCPPVPTDAVEFDPTLTDRLIPWLARRTPLYDEAIVDPDGITRRYRIDRLDDDEPGDARIASGGRR